MKKYSLFLFAIFYFLNLQAQKVTWSEDIACLIYSHCSPCHNSEANSNLLLMSYNDVFNQRLAVELYVNTGQMPPAMHKGDYGKFKNDRHLTQKEIDLIKDWARDLALEGNQNLAPPTPVFPKRVATISNPDITFLTNFQLPDTIEDHLRQCFVINKQPVNSSKRIKSIEIIPGNTAIVHSVFVYADTSSLPLELDMAEIDAGYSNFYGTGSSTSKPLYAWTLDSKPFYLGKDLNLGIDANSYFIVQVQYAEEGGALFDATRINISFDTSTVNARLAKTIPLLAHDLNLVNAPFEIPVDSTIIFHEQQTIVNALTLLSISPNAHGYCDDMKVFAVLPGNDTVGLLQIEDWEAEWSEGPYYFKKPVLIPPGSVLHSFATYSNTVLNQHDPDDPLKTLRAGNDEDSEEMVFYFSYLPYQAGDENISFDTLAHYPHHLNCQPVHNVSGIANTKHTGLNLYPNPASKSINVISSYYPLTLEFYNNIGQLSINKTIKEKSETNIDISGIKTGIYFIRIISKYGSEYKKILIENY